MGIFVYLFRTEKDRNEGFTDNAHFVGEATTGAKFKELVFMPLVSPFKCKAYTPDGRSWFSYQEAMNYLGVEITKEGSYDRRTKQYL